MPIDQSITAFPPAPDSATDTPQVFNTKANAFVDHQSGVYVGEVNQWATEANLLATQVNDDEVSAGNSATQAELDKWNTEAEKLTTQSYANLFVDTNPTNPANYVVVYTSDGDGTFTQTPQTGVYSSRWWTEFNEGESAASKLPKDGSEPMTGNLEAPSMSIGGNYLTPYTMRNKIINGGFDVWQRGTSFSDVNLYTADRWLSLLGNGTNTISSYKQSDGTYLRSVFSSTVGTGYVYLEQRIEDVTTLNGKQATFSFEVGSQLPSNQKVVLELTQNFGVGGSSNVVVDNIVVDVNTPFTISKATFSIPSTSGKIMGTGHYLIARIKLASFEYPEIDGQSGDIYITNFQLEEGSVATPFENVPISLQKQMCRYYYRESSTQLSVSDLAYEMRVTPTESGTTPYTYDAEL